MSPTMRLIVLWCCATSGISRICHSASADCAALAFAMVLGAAVGTAAAASPPTFNVYALPAWACNGL